MLKGANCVLVPWPKVQVTLHLGCMHLKLEEHFESLNVAPPWGMEDPLALLDVANHSLNA